MCWEQSYYLAVKALRRQGYEYLNCVINYNNISIKTLIKYPRLCIFFRNVSSSVLPILFITALRNVLLLNFKSSPLVWACISDHLHHLRVTFCSIGYFFTINSFMEFNFLFKHHHQNFSFIVCVSGVIKKEGIVKSSESCLLTVLFCGFLCKFCS